jgi:hypothetical protein
MDPLALKEILRLVPLAATWVGEQEARILESGLPLDERGKRIALAIGLTEPDKVRILTESQSPSPTDPVLRQAATALGMTGGQTMGISFRYGIYIWSGCIDPDRVLAHELTHTLQYERYGSLVAFLTAYLWECIDPGYPNGPLEQEARGKESLGYGM